MNLLITYNFGNLFTCTPLAMATSDGNVAIAVESTGASTEKSWENLRETENPDLGLPYSRCFQNVASRFNPFCKLADTTTCCVKRAVNRSQNSISKASGSIIDGSLILSCFLI